jgi:hypothetical protein
MESIEIEVIQLLGKIELDELYIVHVVSSNFIKPLSKVPIHLLPELSIIAYYKNISIFIGG